MVTGVVYVPLLRMRIAVFERVDIRIAVDSLKGFQRHVLPVCEGHIGAPKSMRGGMMADRSTIS